MATPTGEMAWPTDRAGLEALQRKVASQTPPPYVPDLGRDLLIGGSFVCFPHGAKGVGAVADPAWAAAAICAGDRVEAIARIEGTAAGPYRPGLLALREGPVLAQAVRRLPEKPDVLLVNATGRDHPRRSGLAVHLGWALDLPSIGVTHRPLFAQDGPRPDAVRGAWAPIFLEGEEVARWLRTRAEARPLVVHAGWRTTLDVAVAVVLAATAKRAGRTPLPIRAARQAAREARALGEGRAVGASGPLWP